MERFRRILLGFVICLLAACSIPLRSVWGYDFSQYNFEGFKNPADLKDKKLFSPYDTEYDEFTKTFTDGSSAGGTEAMAQTGMYSNL